jgi:hypothetical protein
MKHNGDVSPENCLLTASVFPQQMWGPHTLLLDWYQGSFSRIKWWQREVDHPPPSSAEVKNKWRCTSASLYDFIAFVCTTLLSLVFQTISVYVAS